MWRKQAVENENDNKHQDDLERIRQILRDIADKLAKANGSLKQTQPNVAKAHSQKAEEAAEKLRRALEELKKRRKEAYLKKLESHSTPQEPKSDAQDSPAKCDCGSTECAGQALPVYKFDFVSPEEHERLTNLPPITRDEISNTEWDRIWDYLD
jgi:hypothetical protein